MQMVLNNNSIYEILLIKKYIYVYSLMLQIMYNKDLVKYIIVIMCTFDDMMSTCDNILGLYYEII